MKLISSALSLFFVLPCLAANPKVTVDRKPAAAKGSFVCEDNFYLNEVQAFLNNSCSDLKPVSIVPSAGGHSGQYVVCCIQK